MQTMHGSFSMLNKVECPEPNRLRDLLDEMLPDREQVALTRHLGDCGHCQHRLEALALDGQPWSVVNRLGRWSECPGPALGRVIAGLKKGLGGASTGDPAESAPENADVTLDFLTSPTGPEQIGRFGPYEVLGVLGHGGMGIVLEANDPVLNRRVAIKVLAPQLAASGAARKRFAREARAAAAISHEHVVTIHAVGEEAGLPYLVMQCVPGPSLQERLDRDGPLELEEVLRIGLQTAQGLAAAHAQGVVHRDVKPGNILLEDGYRVRLTDFGLARVADDATVTNSGFLPGTPAYMSPEQARGEAVDHRADLFSLGSVLYALCTGRSPFRASTLMGLLRRVSEDVPRPLQEINPRVPDWLVEVMNRLHAKEPARRFQSAQEVAEVFAACLAHAQQPTTASTERLSALGLASSTVGNGPSESNHQDEPSEGSLSGTRSQKAGRRLPKALVAAACLLALVASEASGLTGIVQWAATVLRIRTPDGTLVIEVKDPGVQVTVDGQDVLISGTGIAEVRLRAGQHRVLATKDGKPVLTKLVDIKHNGKEMVTVSLEPAGTQPPAVGRAPVPPVGEPLHLKGHTDRVTSAAFSPDGKVLVTGSADGTVRTWDAVTGKFLSVLPRKGPVVAVKFFSDGKTLLTASEDGTLQLWDVATGKQLASLKLGMKLTSGVLRPDARVFASTGDGAVRLWDVATGKELAGVAGPDGGGRELTFSPDGRTLAIAEGGRVRLWDVGGADSVWLDAPTKNIRSLAFSPDGRRLAAGGDNVVRFWDMSTTRQLWTFTGREIVCVATSPDGKRVAAGDAGGSVWIHDAATGRQEYRLKGKDGAVTCLTFSPDGRSLAWGTASGDVRLWVVGQPVSDAEQRKLRDQLDAAWKAVQSAEERARRAQKGELDARRQADDQRAQVEAEKRRAQLLFYFAQIRLAQASWAKDPKKAREILNETSGDQRGWEWHFLARQARGKGLAYRVLPSESAVRAVAFSPDQKWIAIGTDTMVRLWDVPTGQEVEQCKFGQQGSVSGLAFSPDSRRLALVSSDGVVAVRDLAARKVVLRDWKARDELTAVAFSPNGKLLAVTSKERGQVRLLDAASLKPRRTLEGAVSGLAFSPDGRLVAAAGEDRDIRLWAVSSGKLVRKLSSHTGRISGLAFSPDGRQLASSGHDGKAVLWDVATGQLLHTLKGHQGMVTSVVWSPDGQRLVSGGEDGTARLWDARSGQPVLTLKGHEKAVASVAFSPDGRSILTGSLDGTARLWDATVIPGSKP
jgi:WD40 repeat protein/serine/threonine protein kinase